MIWNFTRGAAQIDIEVYRGGEAGRYTLVVTYADGTERVEQFEDPARLVTRVLAVQQQLIHDGWMPRSPAGGRIIPPRVVPRRRVRYGAAALRAVAAVHRALTRRLAAAFGL